MNVKPQVFNIAEPILERIARGDAAALVECSNHFRATVEAQAQMIREGAADQLGYGSLSAPRADAVEAVPRALRGTLPRSEA